MPKRKQSREQREKIRAERADIFNEGFKMGYQMGYAQGSNDEHQAMKRELNKRANYGR